MLSEDTEGASPPPVPPPAAPAAEPKAVTEEEKKQKIQEFSGLTGADPAISAVFLEMNDWLLEDSVNSFFDHANADKAAGRNRGPLDAEDPDEFVEELKEKAKQYASKATVLGKAAAKTLEKNLGQVSKEVSGVADKFFSWIGLNEDVGPSTALPQRSGSFGSAPDSNPQRAFRTVFPDIPHDEGLLDAQGCCVLQAYRPFNNSLTPELSLVMRATLYITNNFVCVHILDHTYQVNQPVVLAMGDVKMIQHSKKVGNKIRLVIGDTQNLVLKDFDPSTFDRTLAVLKNMWESVQAALAATEPITTAPTTLPPSTTFS